MNGYPPSFLRTVGLGLLFAFAFLFLLASMNRTVNIYDEGIMLVGAMRVAAGQLPHRDFYTNYGPGTYLLLAGLFKAFSTSVLVERLADTAVRALIAVTCFGLCRRLGFGTASHVAYGLAILVLSLSRFYGAAEFPALLGLLAGVWCCVPVFAGQNGRGAPFAAGLAFGAATLFRYDFGLISFGLASLVLVLFLWRQKSRMATATLTAWGLGALTILGPLALVYGLGGALPGWYHDLWQYPSANYVAMRGLPFPGLAALARNSDDIWVYFPVAVWCLAVPLLWRASRRPGDATAATGATGACAAVWTLWLLVLLSGALFAKGSVRVSLLHMAPAAIVSIVLFAFVWNMVQTSPALGRFTVALVWIGLLVMAPHTAAALRLTVPARADRPPRLGAFYLDANRLAAIDWIRRHTEPGTLLFVGAGRHDKIFINDMLFYFLSDRLPATKWAHFDPGLQTTAAVQQDMIREITAKNVPYVVVETDYDDRREPNASALSSGVRELDAFLRAQYVPAAAFGPIIVVRKKDVP